MERAIIIYHSKKGTTKRFGDEISALLKSRKIQTTTVSLEALDNPNLEAYDYVFLGAWTKGLMFFAQHPDKTWQTEASSLKIHSGSRIVLFTTYKLATGSMFSAMREKLGVKNRKDVLEMKSKKGNLTKSDAFNLDCYLS